MVLGGRPSKTLQWTYGVKRIQGYYSEARSLRVSLCFIVNPRPRNDRLHTIPVRCISRVRVLLHPEITTYISGHQESPDATVFAIPAVCETCCKLVSVTSS